MFPDTYMTPLQTLATEYGEFAQVTFEPKTVLIVLINFDMILLYNYKISFHPIKQCQKFLSYIFYFPLYGSFLQFSKRLFLSAYVIVNKLSIVIMSTKKIVRLTSRSKQNLQSRTPQSTFANTRFFDREQVTQVKNVECSETLQVALINEINKIYRELQSIKRQLEKQQQINEELQKQKKILKAQVRILQREYENYKEMYQLQCENHKRLREFCQMREKQWQIIVLSYRQMLEEYDKRNTPESNQNQFQQSFEIGVFSKEKVGTKEEQISSEEQQQQTKVKNQAQRREIKRLKRRPQTQKKKQNLISQKNQKVAYYYAEMHRLYSQQKQFAKKSQLYEQNNQKAAKKPLNRNPEADDIFERILRKTYYHFKSKSLTLTQIKQTEDMVKLKQAKTSTKQRLLKTIKKLQFQVSSEAELQSFCEYIEQVILHQQKMFRGDLVVNFIINKLQQCEQMAQRSNSEISRLDPSILKAQNDKKPKEDLPRKEIERLSIQNLQLMLNSTIKKPPIAQNISSNIRYSISSLQNLSDLIHGQTEV